MSARVPFQVFLLLILHGATCFALPSVTGSYQHIEHVSSRWLTPKEPLDVSAWLPQERPKQPWQYRTAGTAHTSIELTETHALVASVQHAEIPGVGHTPCCIMYMHCQGLQSAAAAAGPLRTACSSSNSRMTRSPDMSQVSYKRCTGCAGNNRHAGVVVSQHPR